MLRHAPKRTKDSDMHRTLLTLAFVACAGGASAQGDLSAMLDWVLPFGNEMSEADFHG
jgi:hypothetical protein